MKKAKQTIAISEAITYHRFKIVKLQAKQFVTL